MTNKFLLPIGSDDLKEFREKLEETRKGKINLKIKMKTRIGNFVEISFEDMTEKPKNFKPESMGF